MHVDAPHVTSGGPDTPGDVSPSSAIEAVPAEAPSSPPEAHEVSPLGLSLGIEIGVVLGVTLFAGMYSLLSPAARISVMIFLFGATLGLTGGMITALCGDLYRCGTGGGRSSPVFSTSAWEGLAVGLGILLGTLPIALACSLIREAGTLPGTVYAISALLLLGVGVIRARSWRNLTGSIAYALLPGVTGALVAHLIGEKLCELLSL